MANAKTDVEIPRSAWSAWIPQEGKRQLRRPLATEERAALEARCAELAPAVAPYAPRDRDRVALALSRMFVGFASMRRSNEEAAMHLDSVLVLLAPFPAWAIERACLDIQTNGVWRDGKFDRHWPPNDSELIDAVRKEARLYADQHRSAVALLEAEVEIDDAL